VLGQPFRFGKSAAQQELDLGVRAAQLIGGPPGQRVVNGRGATMRRSRLPSSPPSVIAMPTNVASRMSARACGLRSAW
jgi:hypothetical protein